MRGISLFSSAPAVTCLLALLIGGSGLRAETPLITGTPSGRILTAGDNRVMILNPAGQVLWQQPAQLTHDVWMLTNGNVLFADGATVTEVTPEKKVVFQYKPAEQKGGGAFSCQRLANGRTLVGENSTGRVLELDAAGQVVFTLQTTPSTLGEHHNMRMARKLDNGNYLVCHSGLRKVKEYTPDGRVVWEVQVAGGVAFAALRTPKGTTLVTSLDQVTEYDAKGEKVWEFACRDLPDLKLQNLTGMHLLANGNLVMGCYRAYQNGAGCGLIEITRDKKAVWRYSNPGGDGTMMPVDMLSPEGQALPGPCLR
jgi:hypothetical protein